MRSRRILSLPVIVISIQLRFSLISQGKLFVMYVKMCHYIFLSICGSQYFIPNISLARCLVCCVIERLLKMNCVLRQCNKHYSILVCDFVQLGRYVPMLSSRLIFSAYLWWSHAPHYRLSYSVIPQLIHSPSWDSPVAKQNHVLLKILKETVYTSATLIFALQMALCCEGEHHRLPSTKFYPVSMLSSDTDVCRKTNNEHRKFSCL
jgi:hypothetical protein